MPQLQPFVPNVPIQLSKNLRFIDANGIVVSELLPIGMNGSSVADTPFTGFMSRTSAVLSNQIDLYNQVVTTLNMYSQDITTLQQQVASLEISGNTIPNVNGFCFTGDAQSPITTVVELIAESDCAYQTALGTPSNLIETIEAEGASLLNIAPSFSISGGQMQALSGWKPNPITIADSISNLWLSYLDSRAGLTKVLSLISPSCSQVTINFFATYTATALSGFSVFLNGYSFIPSGYTDSGSTITIKDGIGGIFTTGINVVNRSNSSDPLFVGISGTALSPVVGTYEVTLNSLIISGLNSCSKTVIHNTVSKGSQSSGSGNLSYVSGSYSGTISGSTQVVNGLSFTPAYCDINPNVSDTAVVLKNHPYYISRIPGGFLISFSDGSTQAVNIDWIAFKPQT